MNEMRRTPLELEQKIVALYRTGKYTQAQICKKYHIGTKTINHILHKYLDVTEILHIVRTYTGYYKRRKLIYCKCRCGKQLPAVNKYGQKREFINGHVWNGRHHSQETIDNILGNNHHNWNGDKISYKGLHIPNLCSAKYVIRLRLMKSQI